jgi:hypothetical protein
MPKAPYLSGTKGLTLSRREETRVQVLNKVLEGKLRLREAAKLLSKTLDLSEGISERHGWRILRAYRRDGPAPVADGNRGRRPANAYPEELKARVLAGISHQACKKLLSSKNPSHIMARRNL